MNVFVPNTTLNPFSRVFLLALAAINLVLGLVFYAVPANSVSYWAWPLKELAVRFLGAILIAISLGCWMAVRASLWQRAKILVLVGGVFFSLTSAVSIFQAETTNGGIAIWAWTVYFLAAGIGCLILIWKFGWRRRVPEPSFKPVALNMSRIFFGIQTCVVGVFGAMMVILPGVAQSEFWPWKVGTPTLQAFGALFLATCIATGWAIVQKDPSRIIALLPLDAVFPSLALLAVGTGWSTIVAESPSWLVTGVWLGLYSFVAVGSTILYVILRRESSVRP